MIRDNRAALATLAAGVLAVGLLGPAFAQDAADEPPEHPVIKPMNGAALIEDSSRTDDFGQMLVRYRQDGNTIDETAEAGSGTSSTSSRIAIRVGTKSWRTTPPKRSAWVARSSTEAEHGYASVS